MYDYLQGESVSGQRFLSFYRNMSNKAGNSLFPVLYVQFDNVPYLSHNVS